MSVLLIHILANLLVMRFVNFYENIKRDINDGNFFLFQAIPYTKLYLSNLNLQAILWDCIKHIKNPFGSNNIILLPLKYFAKNLKWIYWVLKAVLITENSYLAMHFYGRKSAGYVKNCCVDSKRKKHLYN